MPLPKETKTLFVEYNTLAGALTVYPDGSVKIVDKGGSRCIFDKNAAYTLKRLLEENL